MATFAKIFLLLTFVIFVCFFLSFKPECNLYAKNQIETNINDSGIIYKVKEIPETGIPELKEISITESVKNVLAENPRTSTLNLNIATVGSRITLSGKAEYKEQIISAVECVLKIPGVKEVISTVVVDPEIHITSKSSLL